MSAKRQSRQSEAMLNCWRAPADAGDALGCVATTFTFAPAIFDEYCLANFLGIGTDPNREDLPFLLERECRLGGIYAGVLVDYTQSGVAHSLRWDVLPVRIPGGKQHAKVSLLAWQRHVRLIVASANLTESGYRSNYEVASTVDLTPDDAQRDIAVAALAFLRSLLAFVPDADERAAEPMSAARRLRGFLNDVEQLIADWKPCARGQRIRQTLACTLPAVAEQPARGSLEEALAACRPHGGAPSSVRVASPFFDLDTDSNRAVAALCRRMSTNPVRDIVLCVPGSAPGESTPARLIAPKSLWLTPARYGTRVSVELLPQTDPDKNMRPWHAKLLEFSTDQYGALVIGSSNFTSAGL